MSSPSKSLHAKKQVTWSSFKQPQKSSTQPAEESFLDSTKDLFDSQERLMSFLVDNNIDFSEIGSNQFSATIKLINSEIVPPKKASPKQQIVSPQKQSTTPIAKKSVQSPPSKKSINAISAASSSSQFQSPKPSNAQPLKSEPIKVIEEISSPQQQLQQQMQQQQQSPPADQQFDLLQFTAPSIDQHLRFTAFLSQRNLEAGRKNPDEIELIYLQSTPQFQQKVLAYLNSIQQTIILVKNQSIPAVPVATTATTNTTSTKKASIKLRQNKSPSPKPVVVMTPSSYQPLILPRDCDLEILHVLLQKLVHPTDFDNQSMDEFVKSQLMRLEQRQPNDQTGYQTVHNENQQYPVLQKQYSHENSIERPSNQKTSSPEKNLKAKQKTTPSTSRTLKNSRSSQKDKKTTTSQSSAENRLTHFDSTITSPQSSQYHNFTSLQSSQSDEPYVQEWTPTINLTAIAAAASASSQLASIEEVTQIGRHQSPGNHRESKEALRSNKHAKVSHARTNSQESISSSSQQLRSNSKSMSPNRVYLPHHKTTSYQSSNEVSVQQQYSHETSSIPASIQYSSAESPKIPLKSKKQLHSLSTDQLLWYYESIANTAKKQLTQLPKAIITPSDQQSFV